MNHDELKQRVMSAIESNWPQFQADHPALAQVVDQAMLGEFVVASLEDDVEFQAAYAEAVALQVGARAFTGLLERFVRSVMNHLL